MTTIKLAINKLIQIPNIVTTMDKTIKKILLPKTIKHYNKIGKPYGIIINDNMLKFHNNDIRKKIRKEFKV